MEPEFSPAIDEDSDGGVEGAEELDEGSDGGVDGAEVLTERPSS